MTRSITAQPTLITIGSTSASTVVASSDAAANKALPNFIVNLLPLTLESSQEFRVWKRIRGATNCEMVVK